MPQLTLLGQATTGYRTSASEREFNIARATEMFDGVIVAPGEEYSFANSGDFSEDAGFVDGYAIVDGKLEKVIGGGLCQVSTTMFRAVSNAGLAITSRTGHTYVVYFYENILGFDATVFTPYVDFRWRNDTSGPVYIATSSDAQAATVTFQVYGVDDGRTVSYRGPVIRNVVQPGKPIWQFDPKLKPGEVQQLVHGRAGMDVNYYRTVTMPNGAIKHNDNFFTHYKPWEDYYTYGPGVR
jgi:vancomycin resistance protein YoaR